VAAVLAFEAELTSKNPSGEPTLVSSTTIELLSVATINAAEEGEC
jgi:hypothetical protein